MSATSDSTLADAEQLVVDLQRQLGDLQGELAASNAERDAALAREAATAEVLQVINSSPGDLTPVFDAMLEKAMRLCDASFGHLVTSADGEVFTVAAAQGPPAIVEFLRNRPPTRPGSGTSIERLVRGERCVHVHDAMAEEAYRRGDPTRRAMVDLGGCRTFVSVGLRKDDALLGAITVYRGEVKPFSTTEIALIENFAAQAVIAMDNARLLTETREALEQQTATAEVLQVINSSPGDLAPVFDAILEKAHALCGAPLGSLVLYDGEQLRAVATRGYPQEHDALARQGFSPTPPFRLLLSGEPFVHLPDPAMPVAPSDAWRAVVERAGIRTALFVPLRKDATVLGYISAQRQEVRPFSEKQIALLQNFAAQAVIAMENARLLTETREALEQQTATAEILRVISSSPTDVQPTFDAIAAAAATVCGAASGGVYRFDGSLIHFVAHYGWTADQLDAVHSVYPIRPGRGSLTARAIMTRQVAHVADIAADPEFPQPSFVQVGFHTVLSVPMLRDGNPIGAITVTRKEIELFSDKQIDLLKTFADQAVIAIENVRLFNELNERTGDLQESLEYQTATSDVLKVISQSTFDIQPVFETIVETAARLCDADYANITHREGDAYRMVATSSRSPESQRIKPGHLFPINRESLTGRTAVEGRIVHIHDVAADPEYAPAFTGQFRTGLGVPLLREGVVVGTINLGRTRVQPFTERQIELVRTFADQAVIAIENARLITETQEALEQQTATAEVLQVINSSPGDLAPVFDAMLEKALRLCEANNGYFYIYEGERLDVTAVRGPPGFVDLLRRRGPIPITPGTPLERAFRSKALVHSIDVTQEDVYRTAPSFKELIDAGGIRAGIILPLLKEDAFLGSIHIFRQEARAFTNKQIALLENFAAQAVIAMENARLLTETREALEQQTATSEVLQVINSSPGDLAPVFDVILEKAHILCGAVHGVLVLRDGENFRAVGARGLPEAFAEQLKKGFPSAGNPVAQPLLDGAPFVQLPDTSQIDHPVTQAGASVAGLRTVMAVPLRKGDALLGWIVAARREVRLFSEKQIALLQNFAAQAVIAMENARLITETRDALEQQTATADVLQVINSSPGDLAPVFDAMLEKAMRLCEADIGNFWTYDGEAFTAVAMRDARPELVEWASQRRRGGPGSISDSLILGESVIHLPDAADTDAYRAGEPARRAIVDLNGVRTLLAVALRKGDELLGYITIFRRVVRPFSDKQIALLQNFAAQAVIAMENARLLGELQERTRDLEESLEYQTATSDVLKVISRSTFDLKPILDTLCETAARLCGADTAHIVEREGEIYRTAATFAYSPDFDEFVRTLSRTPGRGSVVARALLESRPIHIHDVASDPEHAIPEVVTLGKMRTVLGVPLLREGEPIGVIGLSRSRVEPFTDRQIELVSTFADQAVIAIENTRLITETREALEQQTATAEILEVINRSPGDLAPVFDAILEKAHSLCGVTRGSLQLYDGEKFRAVAVRGLPEPYAERLRQGYAPRFTNPNRRLHDGERVVHIHDWAEIDDPMGRSAAEFGGVRTVVFVALRKDDVLLGQIAAGRPQVRPFSEKEITLLESFAAQAVIAMDNARLLNEIRQRQAELRVTFDNMGDGVAMFDGDLRLAAWNLNFQRILDLPDALLAERPSYADYIRFLAERGEFGAEGIAPELSRRLAETDQELRLERTRPDGQVIEIRRNAVPGGGFVVIYSDVTERKRAEEEIRAARDTAERALQELKTTQASLLHAQKMAALGQLTAGIAHEIKNPLNFVNNFAELSGELLLELKETAAPAVAALGDDERAAVDEVVEMLRGNLDKIAEHGKRADGIVKSMLEHSRGVSGERRAVDLNALIEEALNLAYHGARAQDASFNITLEREFDRGLAPMELAPQEMTRVFLNLFGNGFYATAKRHRGGAGPEFRPTLKVTTRDLGDAVEVRVRDNGTGIAPEIRDKLFQPFVTTKPTGEGTGLGLSISWDIVTQQHGGTIAVDSEVGEFTEFTIRLPRQLHRSGMTA